MPDAIIIDAAAMRLAPTRRDCGGADAGHRRGRCDGIVTIRAAGDMPRAMMIECI